jgi:hypothetical protein
MVIYSIGHLLIVVAVGLALQPAISAGGDAPLGDVRCPCGSGPAATWEYTLEQAMRVADVVMLGKILKLGDGLRGTMNASILSAVTYKGGATFWTQMDDFTNFEKDSPPEISLFFFVREPAGNLALQCMVPLYELSTVGRSLKDLLEFVHETGIRKFENMHAFL